MGLRKRFTRPLFWTTAGAAIAYFCDRQNGRGRRVRLNDQARARARDARRQAERKLRYVQHSAEGKVEALRQAGGAPADDRALVDRIKSEVLGGDRFQNHQVVLEAVDGVVTVRGEVSDAQQAEELLTAVTAVPGVRAVQNLTHLPGQAPPNKESSLKVSTG